MKASRFKNHHHHRRLPLQCVCDNSAQRLLIRPDIVHYFTKALKGLSIYYVLLPPHSPPLSISKKRTRKILEFGKLPWATSPCIINGQHLHP